MAELEVTHVQLQQPARPRSRGILDTCIQYCMRALGLHWVEREVRSKEFGGRIDSRFICHRNWICGDARLQRS